MNIITIKGEDKSGKTTTIRNIFQKITRMKNTRIVEYKTAGYDYTDFDAVVLVNNKTIVIRSYGDGITYIRSGLEYAKSKNADVLINAWSSVLDKQYNINEELPNSKIHNNPVQICESLKKQWDDFSNLIASEAYTQ